MIVYVASPSRGNRALVQFVASVISECGSMAFVPCLGFIGSEHPSDRYRLTTVGLQALAHSHALLAVVDAPTSGVYAEIEQALIDRLPVAHWTPFTSYDSNIWSRFGTNIKYLRTIEGLRTWIYELQENTRNLKG